MLGHRPTESCFLACHDRPDLRQRGPPRLARTLVVSTLARDHLADRLEAELRMYSPLEAILNSAIRYVEARTGRHVDEQLLMLLFDRLGVNDARLAVERIKEMDLDSLDAG